MATVAERVRSTGREGYLLALGLSPRQLFNVVGNHFDPDAVILRMYGALREWADGVRYGAEVLSPAALLSEFSQARSWVVRQQEQLWLVGGAGGAGRVPAAHPFPADLREWLLADRVVDVGGGGGVAVSDAAEGAAGGSTVAAEYGRDGE